MREMRAAVDLRQRQDEVFLRDVADQEDVEERVVGLRVGRDLHPAAEEAPVRDDHVVHRPGARLAVHRDRDLRVPPAGEDGKRAPRVRDLAAEGLARLVHALGDGAAHAGARRIREPRLALEAGPGVEGRPPEVDLARRPVAGDLERSFELVRDPERADEVAAGSAVDDCELDAVDSGDPVHDLVHRSVAANRDQELRASRRGLPREVGEVTLLLGEVCVSLEPALGRDPRHLRPAFPGGAVVGRRVDQEDRVANGRR